MKSLSVLLVPLLALSLSAFAQTAPQQPPADQTAGSSDASSSQNPAPGHHGESAGDRFRAADVNGDGKLTRSEAQALPNVAKHFDEIDTGHKGYVTRQDIRAWREGRKAEREERTGKPSGNGSNPANSTAPPDSGSDGSN